MKLANYLKEAGFAVLLLGGSMTALAQPYEPIVLYEVHGEPGELLGRSEIL